MNNYTMQTRDRLGRWLGFTTYATFAEAQDAANTEIVDGFETIETVRVVDGSGRVVTSADAA